MLENKLKEIFGYPSFRNGQREVIEGLLTGQSMAAIFPTGAGKSMCYQLPATQLPHLTIVISPLLALIQDQLEFLRSHNIAACGIDSTRTYQEILTDQQEIRNGKIKLLFVSVERFNNERFRNFLKEIPISLMVIDEAHCISEWGHNFRPDYLKLPKIREKYQIPQVLLLTATATPKVAKDMSTRFDIKEQNIIQTGFYRPNLDISIRPLDSQQRISYIKKVLDDHLNEATIIYVTLQKTANFLSNVLKEEGFSCEAYHAGLKMEERDAIQCRFMSGETPTIIATIAFGMGIDKSNIRNVIHYDLSLLKTTHKRSAVQAVMVRSHVVYV